MEDAKAARSVLIKASSEAGPELAGRAAIAAMESPEALIAPLKRELEDLKPLGQSPNIIDNIPTRDYKKAHTNV